VSSRRIAEEDWKTHLLLLVINHHIVRLDIAVHDSPRVAEVEGLEQLVDVEALFGGRGR